MHKLVRPKCNVEDKLYTFGKGTWVQNQLHMHSSENMNIDRQKKLYVQIYRTFFPELTTCTIIVYIKERCIHCVTLIGLD
jgi:hypothetical protein